MSIASQYPRAVNAKDETRKDGRSRSKEASSVFVYLSSFASTQLSAAVAAAAAAAAAAVVTTPAAAAVATTPAAATMKLG